MGYGLPRSMQPSCCVVQWQGMIPKRERAIHAVICAAGQPLVLCFEESSYIATAEMEIVEDWRGFVQRTKSSSRLQNLSPQKNSDKNTAEDR
jgi:hypothetical protein